MMISLLFSFVLILSHTLSIFAIVMPNEYITKQTCTNAAKMDPKINYTFCLQALNSDPKSQSASLTDLGLISINLVKNNATNTLSLINRLIGDKTTSNKEKAALEDCSELFTDSIDEINEIVIDYSKKRFDDVYTKVSGVMTGADSCEEGFKDVGIPSVLTKQNDFVTGLGAVTLSIVHMVQQHTH